MQMQFYYQNHDRFELIAPNIYLDFELNEMDICGIRKSGFIDEIEVKLSISDFKADFKKTVIVEDPNKYSENEFCNAFKRYKHGVVSLGHAHCNRFSFLLPEDLVDKCEIPDYAGLYVYEIKGKRARVREEKRASLLHRRKATDLLKYKVARKMAFRYWRKESELVKSLIQSD